MIKFLLNQELRVEQYIDPNMTVLNYLRSHVGKTGTKEGSETRRFRLLRLIGSMTKRKKFELRLKAKGFSDQQLDSMTCPNGGKEVKGKLPAEIAVSVAGQVITKYNAAFVSQKDQTPAQTQEVDRLAI